MVRILLDNALRYAPRGEPIRLTAGCAGRRAHVEVADRGPGVHPAEREQIFERFQRGRSASAEAGFGLGLAIGRELAERMGGTLALAGEDGEDTRFRLELPAAEAGPEPAPEPGPETAGGYSLQQDGRAQDVDARLEVGRADRDRGQPRVVGEVLAPLGRAHAHELGPRRLPAREVVDDRLDEHDPPPARQRVEQRLEVLRGVRRRAAARTPSRQSVTPRSSTGPHSVA